MTDPSSHHYDDAPATSAEKKRARDDRKNAARKIRSEKRRQAGRCTVCNDEALPNLTKCQRCYLKSRKPRKKISAAQRKRENEARKKRRAERRLVGLCMDCGKTACDKGVYCDKCRVTHNRNSAKYRTARDRKRIALGLCKWCGVATKGQAYCEMHRLYMRAADKACAKRQFERDPETARASWRAAYQDRKSRGICVSCAGRPSRKYSVQCVECREYHRARPRDNDRLRQRSHPEIAQVSRAKRRSALAAAEGRLTTAEWDAIKRRQRDRCAYAGSPAAAVDCHSANGQKCKLTIDHKTPLRPKGGGGGTNFAFNIQGLCLPCNSAKCNKIMPEAEPSLFDKPIKC